jgi:hypothetical protein
MSKFSANADSRREGYKNFHIGFSVWFDMYSSVYIMHLCGIVVSSNDESGSGGESYGHMSGQKLYAALQ